MILFYTNNIEGEFAYLDSMESKHCIQVLRKKEGETVYFIDGIGGMYRAEVEEANRKKCVLHILEKLPNTTERPYKLILAVAPTKHIDRFEFVLEKATEIGVDVIVPILCKRSERKVIKQERLEKVILSAAKQSKKAFLPKLAPMQTLKKAIEHYSADQKFIAYCEEVDRHLQHNIIAGKDVLLLIGPEGDFTDEEVALCKQNSFLPVSLGTNRLRTETAAIFGTVCVQLSNNQ